MNKNLHPTMSEFAPEGGTEIEMHDLALHDEWFRAKVEASLRQADDPGTPRYSTNEVARRMEATIQLGHAPRRLA